MEGARGGEDLEAQLREFEEEYAKFVVQGEDEEEVEVHLGF